MPAQPTDVPRWATDGGATVNPAAGEKDTGWVVDNKPPARKMNWLFNTIYDWVLYLQNPVGTGAGAGVDATGGPTDGLGLKGTGGGTNGGGTSGVAVGTGTGAKGLAVDGHGMVAESDTTAPAKAALRVVPQNADPVTAPAQGDSYVNTVDGTLTVYDGFQWRRMLSVAYRNITTPATIAPAATTENAFAEEFRVDANTLRSGTVIKIATSGTGNYGDANTATLRIHLSPAGSPLTGALFTLVLGAADAGIFDWTTDTDLIIRADPGASVTIATRSRGYIEKTSGIAGQDTLIETSDILGFPTNADLDIEVSIQFSSAHVSNDATLHNFKVEKA